MSLVSQSLGFNFYRISHSSPSGFKHHDFAGAGLLTGSRTQLLARIHPAVFWKQPLRVVNAVLSEGNGEPYPSREVEAPATGFQIRAPELKVVQTHVGLNEAAPLAGNVFGESSAKEVNILEDPVGFFRFRLDQKLQKARRVLASLEQTVAPSPYSPTQGDDVVIFLFLSVALILLFWLGNYLAPTWIFKETVFRNSRQNRDDNVEEIGLDEKPIEDEVDPADLIQLPTNLRPFTPAAVAGFKAGRQRAREEEEKRRKKRSQKRK